MKKIISILILLFFIQPVFAKHIYPEKYYQNEWCKKWSGTLEYTLKDATRVDCVTKTYAVEFDFAPKWAEAIGQSLYYAKKTKRKPAIVLILEADKDVKYISRAKEVSDDYNITLWTMKSPAYNGATNVMTQNRNNEDIFSEIQELQKNIEKFFRNLIKFLKQIGIG